MSMRDAAPLLSLLGHELRAPVGVVGGYLALLEQGRDQLTPDQEKAVAGARRAQQSMVDALDDLRRLTVAWRAEAEPVSWVTLPRLVEEVLQLAAVRGVPLTVDRAAAPDGAAAVAVARRGRDTALAEALVALAEAVAREHGADAVADTAVDHGVLVWRVRPAGADPAAPAVAHDFDVWRAGLGVRVVAATVTIAASHGTLADLRVADARYGVVVRFDLQAAGANAPPDGGA